jgi:hypothetical protein
MKEVDGIVYEAECRKITVGGESFDTGGNPSAEEGEETLDDAAQTVLDVAHSFRLQETSFDKKSYLSHLKSAFRRFLPFFFPSSWHTSLPQPFPSCLSLLQTRANGHVLLLTNSFSSP